MRKGMVLLLLAASLIWTMSSGAQAAGEKAAAKKEPIKIGAMFALSGPAAHIGTPTKLVAEMVVKKINQEGGINGRPIKLILGDTESNPAKAASLAKKFIFTDKVAAIIGPTTTGSGRSWKKRESPPSCAWVATR